MPPRAASLEVACVQMVHGEDLDANLERADAHVEAAADDGAELVLLPEYWFVELGHPLTPDTAARYAEVPDALEAMSRRHDVAVAGNGPLLEDAGLRNACFLADQGETLGLQRKVHPMPREAGFGVEGGEGFPVFELRGTTVGLVVCADVLFPEVPRILSVKGAEVLLVPVMSPWRGDRSEDRTRGAREDLFVARAYDASAYVLKAGGFTRPDQDVVGRSLVAAPWGLEARYADQWREERLRARLDLEAVRAHREGQVGLRRRRPETYGDLVDPALGPTLDEDDDA